MSMLTPAVEPQSIDCIEVSPGLGLRVHDWDAGRPVVIIPGWPLTDETYDYQMSALARTGFRAISIPLRGISKTGSPWETYGYYLFADDIMVIASYLDLNAVTLAGRKMGGAIAIHYTAYHEGRRVPRLALFGAPAPVWTRRANGSRGYDKPDPSYNIEVLDTGLPMLQDSSCTNLELEETPISPGVATWFLCQGRLHNADSSRASLRDDCS
jgi:non-heme chloroperoxidase